MAERRGVTPTFADWLDDLDMLAQATYGFRATDGGADAWRAYYDEGYVPSEALSDCYDDE